MIARAFEVIAPAAEKLIYGAEPLAARAHSAAVIARHDLGRALEPLRWRALSLVPRSVLYWALIEAGRRECGGPNRPDEVVPSVPFVAVLQRFGDRAVYRRSDGQIVAARKVEL